MTIVSTVKFEADEASVKHAIDVGGEMADAQRDQPAPVKRRTPAEEEDAPEDAEGYTARLLKAKRRARGEDDNASGQGENG